MADVSIAALVLLLLADVVWANGRWLAEQRHSDRLTVDHAAERRGLRPRPAPGLLALGEITAPCNRDLYTWLAATDGAPTVIQGHARFTGEADTVTPGSVVSLYRRLAAT